MKALIVMLAFLGTAYAEVKKPKVWLATEVTKSEPKATQVVRHGGTTSYVNLRTIVVPTAVEVVSINNDNTAFQLRIGLAKPVPSGRWPVVGVAGTFWRAESHGGSGTTGNASFTLDREAAVKLSKAFGTRLAERSTLGGDLTYTWTIPNTATTNEAAPITLTLKVVNNGKATVGFVVGGMMGERGDGRFVPEVTRDGKPLLLVEVHGANGGFAYQRLAPGGNVEVTTNLRGYVVGALTTPGTYKVAIRYDGQLSKDAEKPGPGNQAHVWDIAPSTTATVTVR